MFNRLTILGMATLALTSLGASRRTANFVVTAPTQEIADRVAQHAEQQRKDQALTWLGKELPTWKEPCTIDVQIHLGHHGGTTTFYFAPRGGVKSQKMDLWGPLDNILGCTLPHEITHTIFAHYLGKPVPRWADEGGAGLAEGRNLPEQYAKVMKKALKAGKLWPLRRLFALHEYPRQRESCLAFYGQSYSVSRFLIETGTRAKFLEFMKRGYNDGWDEAAQTVYQFPDVEALERAWLAWERQR